MFEVGQKVTITKEIMITAKIGGIETPVLINDKIVAAKENWVNLWYDVEILQVYGEFAQVAIPELNLTVWTNVYYLRDKQE